MLAEALDALLTPWSNERFWLTVIVIQSLNVAVWLLWRAAAPPSAAAPPVRAAAEPDMSTALAERQRIAGDLHDGVASRLVVLLASLPPQDSRYTDIARGLQECLLELQLTVDELGAERASLGEMLADLRYRFEPAFHRAGIQLIWDVADIAPQAPDDHRAHRELCKIVQEALTNALRHSGARRVRVSLKSGHGSTPPILEISDDGHGLRQPEAVATPHRQGQGLRNMRARAQSIHADIRITNMAPCGLRVGVTLPQLFH
jgi:signal transduction histidine kinase